jgi:hypothetical protein
VEEFHVAVLDAQHRLERDVLVTRGILNSSLVHPREVFREAIAERAASIVSWCTTTRVATPRRARRPLITASWWRRGGCWTSQSTTTW